MITLEQLVASHMRQSVHFDGPRGKKGFFGDIKQSVEFPRLTRKETCYRATRSVVVEYLVDGIKVDSFDAVVTALNAPPVVTEEEKAALELVGAEFQRWSLLVAGPLTLEVLQRLVAKGLVDMDHGECRRRPA